MCLICNHWLKHPHQVDSALVSPILSCLVKSLHFFFLSFFLSWLPTIPIFLFPFLEWLLFPPTISFQCILTDLGLCLSPWPCCLHVNSLEEQDDEEERICHPSMPSFCVAWMDIPLLLKRKKSKSFFTSSQLKQLHLSFPSSSTSSWLQCCECLGLFMTSKPPPHHSPMNPFLAQLVSFFILHVSFCQPIIKSNQIYSIIICRQCIDFITAIIKRDLQMQSFTFFNFHSSLLFSRSISFSLFSFSLFFSSWKLNNIIYKNTDRQNCSSESFIEGIKTAIEFESKYFCSHTQAVFGNGLALFLLVEHCHGNKGLKSNTSFPFLRKTQKAKNWTNLSFFSS